MTRGFGLSAAALLVAAVTLSLGLWPFHSPRNDVRWLSGADGVLFGDHGTVLGRKGPVRPLGSYAITIELWVQPARWLRAATILSLYDPRHRALLKISQSLTDVRIFVQEADQEHQRVVYVKEALGSALRRDRPVLLTITDGPSGMTAYVDGELRTTAPASMVPSEARAGRLILGDSPWEPNSFQGTLLGLALYGVELSVAEVRRHHRAWLANHDPGSRPDNNAQALYLFNERVGNIVHDRAAVRGDLDIPSTYRVVDKVLLEPFWREFESSPSYWNSNLENVVGFVPAGVVFCAFFRLARRVKRPLLTAVIAGFLVSLTIEVVQTFLSTRYSGTTDLFTNTFGTFLGAAALKYAMQRWPGAANAIVR